MKKVLITGGDGFIGRHCLPKLRSRGFEVHATCRKSPRSSVTEVTWHGLDLLEGSAVADLVRKIRPTHLLHLAWVTKHGKYWTAPENLLWVEASLNLTNVFTQQGGKRAVFAGTCAEYDWRHGYCVENLTPLAPNSLYGKSKRALWLAIDPFGKQVGLSLAWGRLFFLYGPYEHPGRLVPSLITPLLRGEPAHCTHGRQIRDFLYVEDAADCLTALLDSDLQGEFNIASGIPIALNEVADRIANIIGKPEMMSLGNPEPNDASPAIILGEVSRLRNELAWSPAHDIVSGLDLAIQWWRAELLRGFHGSHVVSGL